MEPKTGDSIYVILNPVGLKYSEKVPVVDFFH
jgi:hypothetical protein